MLLGDAELEAQAASACLSPPATPQAARLFLERLAARAARIADNPWAQALERQCLAAAGELAGTEDEAGRRTRERRGAIERLAREAGQLARMEYGFLVDKSRQLLAIGYNVAEGRLDASCYDLLAS